MINLCDVCKLRRELRFVMLGGSYKFFIYIRNNFKDDFLEPVLKMILLRCKSV